MGIGDYGKNPLLGNRSYTTSSFVGNVSLAKLSTYLYSNDTNATDSSFQLNVVLKLTGNYTPRGGGPIPATYAYWIQDVVRVHYTQGNYYSSSITYSNNISEPIRLQRRSYLPV